MSYELFLLVGSVSVFRFEGCFLESIRIGSLDAEVSANIFTTSLGESVRKDQPMSQKVDLETHSHQWRQASLIMLKVKTEVGGRRGVPNVLEL